MAMLAGRTLLLPEVPPFRTNHSIVHPTPGHVGGLRERDLAVSTSASGALQQKVKFALTCAICTHNRQIQ